MFVKNKQEMKKKEYIERYGEEAYEEYKAQVREYNRKHKEQQKEYREANKERLAQYQKDYYNTNKKQLAQQRKEYYNTNKEQIAQKQREYYEANRKQIAQQKKEYNKEYNNTPIGRATNLIRAYRASDRKYDRGECTLTTDYMVNVLYPFGCVYCGEMDWKKLGADRIDNTKPHTPDNVVCCCGECNIKKNTTDTYTYFTNSPVWQKFGVLCE